MRVVFLLVCIAFVLGGVVIMDDRLFLYVTGYPSIEIFRYSNSLDLSADKEIEIKPRASRSFNELTRRELFKAREEQLLAFPTLMSGAYQTTAPAFAEIVDRHPWWGIEGLYLYGKGDRSSSGISEESRYFLNPLLLIGVTEAVIPAYLQSPAKRSVTAPVLQSLRIHPADKRSVVHYSIADFHRMFPAAKLQLVTYNAQDFGFNWLAIDHEQSKNIQFLRAKRPVMLKQFIHIGGSCGATHGCQNMSPGQKELELNIQSLPARILVHLWQRQPDSDQSVPDFSILLDFH